MDRTVLKQLEKEWPRAKFEELFRKSDEAVHRALRFLFERQTSLEQARQETVFHNNQGFMGHDARLFSYMVKELDKTGRLKPWMYRTLRAHGKFGMRLARYDRQLREGIAKKREAEAYRTQLELDMKGGHA